MKMAAIGDFLTESEIKKVLKLYKENKNQDLALGQENLPRYLAYAILYAMMKAK